MACGQPQRQTVMVRMFRGNVCHPNKLASKSMFRPSIPMLYPRHAQRAVPFSYLQELNSFMRDWKKWWQVSVMTILTSLDIIACSWAPKSVPKSLG